MPMSQLDAYVSSLHFFRRLVSIYIVVLHSEYKIFNMGHIQYEPQNELQNVIQIHVLCKCTRRRKISVINIHGKSLEYPGQK